MPTYLAINSMSLEDYPLWLLLSSCWSLCWLWPHEFWKSPHYLASAIARTMTAMSVNEPNIVTYHPRSWDSCLYEIAIMNLVRNAGILSPMNSWWPWSMHCPLGSPLEQNILWVMWPYLAYPLQCHVPQPLYSSLYLCQRRRGISISLLSAYPGFWEPL